MRGSTSASTSSDSSRHCGRAVRRRVTTPAAEFFLAFTLLSVCCDACDICDGTRGQRSLADGSIDEVLALSARGWNCGGGAPAGLVLLYAPSGSWTSAAAAARGIRAGGAGGAARGAARGARARRHRPVPVGGGGAAGAARGAADAPPAARFVGYGSEWRGGRGAGDLVTYLREEAATPTAVRTLDDDAAAAAFAALSDAGARTAVAAPASAFANWPPPFAAPSDSQWSRAPRRCGWTRPSRAGARRPPRRRASRRRRPAARPPVEAETVVLLRERSTTMEGEMPELVMPVVGGALEPHALQQWVRWAALPTVPLTSEVQKRSFTKDRQASSSYAGGRRRSSTSCAGSAASPPRSPRTARPPRSGFCGRSAVTRSMLGCARSLGCPRWRRRRRRRRRTRAILRSRGWEAVTCSRRTR